jgi:hypothetical protein
VKHSDDGGRGGGGERETEKDPHFVILLTCFSSQLAALSWQGRPHPDSCELIESCELKQELHRFFRSSPVIFFA